MSQADEAGRRCAVGVSQKTCKADSWPKPFEERGGHEHMGFITQNAMFWVFSRCKYSLQTVCILGVLLSGGKASAQERTDSVGEKAYAIPEVRVRGELLPQRTATALPTQVMSRDELRLLGLSNLADAVRRMAGTQVKDYGGIGGLKTVSVRSLGTTHTAVAYDGVAVSNTQAGQIDIGHFDIETVDRVALAVGQHNDLLQPARLFASAAVLSFQSRNPLDEAVGSHLFEGRVQLGSFGLVKPSLLWGQRLTDRTAVALKATYLRADGNYPFTLVNGREVTQERRLNSDIRSGRAEVDFFHNFSASSRLQVKGYYYDSERGLPGAVIYYVNQARERLWDRNAFAQARLDKHWGERWRLQLQGKFTHSWNKYEDTDVKYKGGKQTDLYRQHEYYLSGALLWQASKHWTASLSNDLAVNTLWSNQPEPPLPLRRSWLSAFNLRYTGEGLTLTAGAVYTYMSDRVQAGNRPADARRLSPTVSLLLRPWSAHEFYVRALYKHNFRVPTFNDFYYWSIGNTSLKPEKAQEWNVGLTWAGRPFEWLDYLACSVDAYHNRVEDKIVALPTTYVWRMMNFGRVNIVGAEVTLRAEIMLPHRLRLKATANYTYQRAVDITQKESKNYGHQLPYTPRHSGNASLLLHTPWADLGYTLTAVSNRYALPQNIASNRIDGYAEHSLAVTRHFVVGRSHRLRLQAELNNLTNEQYDIIKFYPMPGRSLRLTAGFQF